MNVLIDINHPAHVHLLRNLYKTLVNNGHSVYVLVKDIPSAKKSMDLYNIKYQQVRPKIEP